MDRELDASQERHDVRLEKALARVEKVVRHEALGYYGQPELVAIHGRLRALTKDVRRAVKIGERAARETTR